MGGIVTDHKPAWLDWRGNNSSCMIANMDTDDTPLPAHKPAFLRRVQIRGYKSIAFCDVTLEPLTILVGRNASGKSNFLDALEFLRDAIKFGVRESTDMHGGREAIECLSIQNRRLALDIDCLFEGCAPTQGYFAYQAETWKANYSIEVEFANGKSPKIAREQLNLTVHGSKKTTGYRIYGHSLRWLGDDQGSRYPAWHSSDKAMLQHYDVFPFSEFARLLLGLKFHDFHPDSMRELKIPLSSSLDRSGGNIANILAITQEMVDEDFSRIQRYLHIITETVELHEIAKYGEYITPRFRIPAGTNGMQNELDAKSMSDGTLRALGAITSVFQSVLLPEDRLTLVAIEEPETALHPAAMRALVSAFDAATMRTQVLLTTHSPDLLDAEEIRPVNVRIVQMIDGQTVIGPIDEASVEIVRQNLDTLGGLERNDSLQIDHDDLQRQRAMAAQLSEVQS